MNNHPKVENVPKIGAYSIKYLIEGDSMFNQATLMGRITHDLELKTAPSGAAPAADPAAAPSTPPPAPAGPLDPPFPPAGADFDPYPF